MGLLWKSVFKLNRTWFDTRNFRVFSFGVIFILSTGNQRFFIEQGRRQLIIPQCECQRRGQDAIHPTQGRSSPLSPCLHTWRYCKQPGSSFTTRYPCVMTTFPLYLLPPAARRHSWLMVCNQLWHFRLELSPRLTLLPACGCVRLKSTTNRVFANAWIKKPNSHHSYCVNTLRMSIKQLPRLDLAFERLIALIRGLTW